MSPRTWRRALHTAPVRPAPPALVDLRELLQPVFWIINGLLVFGAWRVGGVLRSAFTAYPAATSLAVALFAGYAVPFLLFIQHLDYFEREPPVLLATAFAWGGLVAVAAAIPGNAALDSLVGKWISPAFAATWGPALAVPTIEEVLKILGVVAIALVAPGQINSVVDGFVYGALVGLGFQVVENVVYAANAVGQAGLGDQPGPVIGTFFVRGFLAGLWSHTMFSALAGAGVGYAVVRRDRSRGARFGFAVMCLLGAWLCHAAWNSPLLAHGLGLGVPGILVELLVKGIPALVVILALVRSAGDREADYYGAVLAEVGDSRVATPAEILALGSAARRAAARQAGRDRAGRRGAHAVRVLQRSQAQLAVELSRGGELHSGAGRYWYREVLRNRHRLLALGCTEAAPPPRRRPSGEPVSWLSSTWVSWLFGCLVAALLALALNMLIRTLG